MARVRVSCSITCMYPSLALLSRSRIIEISSTPPRATTPDIPLTLPRATPLYGSPDSRAALSPAKPHPFHQSAATTSRLSRPKQPIFVVDDSSDDDIRNMSAKSPPLLLVPRPPPGTSYPLHPVSKTVRIPVQPTVQLLSAKARKKRANTKILAKTQDAAEGGQMGMKGKGVAKGDANPAGLPVFQLGDREWGAPQVVYSRSKEEVEDLVGCLNRSSPLSFDMEWPISFRCVGVTHFVSVGCRLLTTTCNDRKGRECKTALLQIGDGKLVVLCQISAMYYKIRRSLPLNSRYEETADQHLSSRPATHLGGSQPAQSRRQYSRSASHVISSPVRSTSLTSPVACRTPSNCGGTFRRSRCEASSRSILSSFEDGSRL